MPYDIRKAISAIALDAATRPSFETVVTWLEKLQQNVGSYDEVVKAKGFFEDPTGQMFDDDKQIFGKYPNLTQALNTCHNNIPIRNALGTCTREIVTELRLLKAAEDARRELATDAHSIAQAEGIERAFVERDDRPPGVVRGRTEFPLHTGGVPYVPSWTGPPPPTDFEGSGGFGSTPFSGHGPGPGYDSRGSGGGRYYGGSGRGGAYGRDSGAAPDDRNAFIPLFSALGLNMNEFDTIDKGKYESAWRQAARKFHPDLQAQRSASDAGRAKALEEKFKILSDLNDQYKAIKRF